MTPLADLTSRSVMYRAFVPTRHEEIGLAVVVGIMLLIAAAFHEPVRPDGRPSAASVMVCLLLLATAAVGIPIAAGLA